MKNFILFLMLCVTLVINAEEATTSCMVGNSNTDYVSATAYTAKNGNLGTAYVTVANSSNKPLVSLMVTVTAEKCELRWNKKQTASEEVWTPITLLSENIYFSPAISPNSQSKRINCRSVNSYGGKLKNIDISIGNPSCK